MTPPRDVVIVGAGIIGCAVGHELARRGASVEIIDDRTAGMGATQASAGVLAPFIEARKDGPLLELTARSLELFDGFVHTVQAQSGCGFQYQRTGTIDVATTRDALAGIEAAADWLVRRGVAAELLAGAALLKREPSLSTEVIGGLFVPSHGFVAAGELTRAVAVAARRCGARLIEHDRVRRLSLSGSEVHIETTRGHLSADAVVVAAGSWAGQIEIEGAEPLPVRPVRGQLLQLGWSAPQLRCVTWSERCYLVPWQDGTVLVGATVEEAGFDERTTLAGVGDLIDAACELIPHAWTASLIAAKVGLRPATPDQLPIIGPSAAMPQVVYATGHFRNGILLAPLTATLVADAMLESRVDPLLTLTSPTRFGFV